MSDRYWQKITRQFLAHRLGVFALGVAALFCIVGIYAPFLASSKPIVVNFNGEWYFPLFRYLFFSGFYTKRIDLFFNLLMFTFPLIVISLWLGKKRWGLIFCIIQLAGFLSLLLWPVKDPAFDRTLAKKRQEAFYLFRKNGEYPSWKDELAYLTPYAKLNLVLEYQLLKDQNKIILSYAKASRVKGEILTLWAVKQKHFKERVERLGKEQGRYAPGSIEYKRAKASLMYSIAKQKWLESESRKISWKAMPLIRPYHWEDDVGGDQEINQFLPWWELSRINSKDLAASLIFGVRISLVVGLLAVSLAMMIGIPIGSIAGYYGGKWDIIVCRLLEIWESMPTFFMLLLVIAVLQSKSIFIVVAVVGLFGWTGFSRYIRGEFLKQRNFPYVEACRAIGYNDSRIIFSHILPNAVPPVLTLLPFAIMAAITSEAGLSFLGLGEEGSCSWGVLMDEGRSVFPAQSSLMWPPAILLTTLLVAIALVGDAVRDAIDPKMQK